MSECTANKCAEPTTVRLYWPGREPMDVCTDHGAHSMGIAKAMGFHVHTESIADDPLAGIGNPAALRELIVYVARRAEVPCTKGIDGLATPQHVVSCLSCALVIKLAALKLADDYGGET